MIDRDRLAQAVGELDAGTRALLDLSLRRAIPDDQVAAALGVDARSIPPRRARGIAELADKLEVPGPSELAALLLAIPELPDEAWAVPKVAPFSGKVSQARRARAFRRVAIAASPAVALGAVIAAIVVSAGSDQSIHGTPTGATVGGGGGGGGGAPAAAAPAGPEARHGLPDGSHLASAADQRRRASHRRAARKHHRARRHHAPGSAEHAIQAREPAVTPRTTPVSFMPTPDPAPVVRETPKHVTHHHQNQKPAPKKPSTPVQTPAVPAPAPAPPQQVTTVPAPPVETQQHSTLTAPVSKPSKPAKPPVPQPNIHPYGNGSGESSYERHDEGGGGGGGCRHGDDDSYDSDSSDQNQGDGGSAHDARAHRSGRDGFTPPGLFKKRYGPGRS
jgi:hypothetical protein